jgi:hypothetical protein
MSELEFVTGVTATLALSGLSVLYLNRSMRRVLLDLCGTQDRADFWCAFSTTLLMLLPLVFAMIPFSPSVEMPRFLVVAGIVERGMVGLAVSLMAVGLTLSHYIAQGMSRR